VVVIETDCIQNVMQLHLVCLFAHLSSRCEENIDDCVDHKCKHGTCVDIVDGYICNCSVSIDGRIVVKHCPFQNRL